MVLTRNTGYSMMEVVVAATVFVVASAGVLGTISSTRAPVAESQEKIQALACALRAEAQLRAKLDADTWDSAAWDEANNPHTLASGPGCGDYAITYKVTDMGDGGKEIEFTVTPL